MDRYCFTSRDNVSGIRFILDRLTNDLPPTVSVDVHCAFDLDGDRPLEKIELDKKIRIFREIKEEFRHRWVGRANCLFFRETVVFSSKLGTTGMFVSIEPCVRLEWASWCSAERPDTPHFR